MMSRTMMSGTLRRCSTNSTNSCDASKSLSNSSIKFNANKQSRQLVGIVLNLSLGGLLAWTVSPTDCWAQCATPGYSYFDDSQSWDYPHTGLPEAELPSAEFPNTGASATFNNIPSFTDTSMNEQFASLGSSTFVDTNGGYIDGAVPMDQIRFRFEAAYDNPFPDRAEFFYAQCACNGIGANGPPLPELSVDYQQFNILYERTLSSRLSVFADTPVRLLDPVVNDNTAGFSDLELGFKFAFYRCSSRYWTFQLKTYVPTGDANSGLGTGHVSIEPGLLYFQRLDERTTFEGELRYWLPLADSVFGGQPYDGRVIRYGAGLSRDLYAGHMNCGNSKRLSAVGELVGWTILSGQALNANGPAVFNVDGQDIINAKIGARWTAGRHSFYVGYGRALTGNVWYEDIVRAEYRLRF